MLVRSGSLGFAIALTAALATVGPGCAGSAPPRLDEPPSQLAYSTNPADYSVGVAITANAPSSGGGPVKSYAVAPALPVGLSLDATTGVITGIPAAPAAEASYTVTARSTGGSTTAGLSIAVHPAPVVLVGPES